MSMFDACVVEGCKNRSKSNLHCTVSTRVDGISPLACDYGRFSRILHDYLRDMGEWKLLQYKDGPMKATLRGKCGAIEVWGGRHAGEVWFVERGTKAETLLCKSWSVTDGSLRKAVKRGCAMAGIQTQLAIER